MQYVDLKRLQRSTRINKSLMIYDHIGLLQKNSIDFWTSYTMNMTNVSKECATAIGFTFENIRGEGTCMHSVTFENCTDYHRNIGGYARGIVSRTKLKENQYIRVKKLKVRKNG